MIQFDSYKKFEKEFGPSQKLILMYTNKKSDNGLLHLLESVWGVYWVRGSVIDKEVADPEEW